MNDVNAGIQRNIKAGGNVGDDKHNWNWPLLISVSGLALYQWFMQRKMKNEIDCLRRNMERNRREDKGLAMIHDIRRLLYARQDIICRNAVPYFVVQRSKEEELTSLASSDPVALQLNIQADLLEIFKSSESCSRATVNTCVEDWQRKLKNLLENEQK